MRAYLTSHLEECRVPPQTCWSVKISLSILSVNMQEVRCKSRDYAAPHLIAKARQGRVYAAQGGFVLSLELPEDDKYYDDKADILELNGLSEAASFVLRPNEEPSEQLLGFLRLINLSGKPLHRCMPELGGGPCFW